MGNKHLLLTVFFFCASPNYAAAQGVSVSETTGGMLADTCKSENSVLNDYCTGYILGVADALQLEGRTCRPHAPLGLSQVLAVVKKYLRDNPERWNLPGYMAVSNALVDAFPCRQ